MATIKKFLDTTGLATVWAQVKSFITTTINNLDSTKTGNGSLIDVTVKQIDGKITEVAVDDTELTYNIINLDNMISSGKTNTNTHNHTFTSSGSVGTSSVSGTVTPTSSYNASNGIVTLTAAFDGGSHSHTFSGGSSTTGNSSHSHSLIFDEYDY